MFVKRVCLCIPRSKMPLQDRERFVELAEADKNKGKAGKTAVALGDAEEQATTRNTAAEALDKGTLARFVFDSACRLIREAKTTMYCSRGSFMYICIAAQAHGRLCAMHELCDAQDTSVAGVQWHFALAP